MGTGGSKEGNATKRKKVCKKISKEDLSELESRTYCWFNFSLIHYSRIRN